MFSGIVEETGTISKVIKKKNLSVISVKAKKVLGQTKEGTSICVNGVCLTVTKRKKDIITFDIMKETLTKTNLGQAFVGYKVNLERSLKVSDRICGHFVSGHVDNMMIIKDVITDKNYIEIRVGISKELKKYVVPKGSVCLDGVSLTVGEVRKSNFSVYLIPFTLEVTNLGLYKKGDKINVETDIIAKYIFAQRDSSNSPYSYHKKSKK